jgi:formamidopyrimidine-DNA glycosylase
MRGLDRALTGQVLARAEATRPDLRRPFPPDLRQALTGARITGFRRRAKYILMRTDRGRSVLIHLGMSGRMVLGGLPQAHEHLVMETESGVRVGFVDPRRFGSVDLVTTAAEDGHPLLAGLGPEPLDDSFDSRMLEASLAGRRTPIKAALLDQRVVAGVGNIYACEALHRAGVAPGRPAGAIGPARLDRLAAAVREVISEAIEAGGSSISDFSAADGSLGYFQHRFRVYGREGEPCPVCARPVKRMMQSGRSSFHCTSCQR